MKLIVKVKIEANEKKAIKQFIRKYRAILGEDGFFSKIKEGFNKETKIYKISYNPLTSNIRVVINPEYTQDVIEVFGDGFLSGALAIKSLMRVIEKHEKFEEKWAEKPPVKEETAATISPLVQCIACNNKYAQFNDPCCPRCGETRYTKVSDNVRSLLARLRNNRPDLH
jgi:hypothetical protein